MRCGSAQFLTLYVRHTDLPALRDFSEVINAL